MRMIHLCGLLAAPAFATSAFAALQTDLEVLAITGQDLPGTGLRMISFSDVQPGVTQGWAVSSLLRDLTTNDLTWGLLGNRTADGTGGLTVLRLPTTLSGVQQGTLRNPVLADGRLGYVASESPNMSAQPDSAWIDDQVLAVKDDLIGTGPLEWSSFARVRPLPGGRAVVRGRAQLGVVVVEFPSEQVVLAAGSVLPTGPTVVQRLPSIQFSPNGQHYIARVEIGPSSNRDSALVVDGDFLTFEGGDLAIQDQATPAGLIAGGYDWGRFLSARIDNDGRATFEAEVLTGTDIKLVVVRGERLVLEPDAVTGEKLLDTTPSGLALITNNAGRLLLDEVDLVSTTPTFDADGDGAPDAGWERLSPFGTTTGPKPWAARWTSSGLLSATNVRTPNSDLTRALVSIRRGTVGATTCPGVPSSIGRPASLTLVGDSGASENDLTLQCIDMPRMTTGLGLVSANSGFVAMPGGSAGNLCLGGAIGRFSGQVFSSGEEGRGVVSVDLTALPQPTGTASAAAGQTWFFQVWYRDVVSGSNFSSALAIVLD